jgi:cytochrome c oxidase cbb3-type subunit 4
MTIYNLLTDARSALTVVSLVTFLGIIFWSYSPHRSKAFEEAANLPFADEIDESGVSSTEKHHG